MKPAAIAAVVLAATMAAAAGLYALLGTAAWSALAGAAALMLPQIFAYKITTTTKSRHRAAAERITQYWTLKLSITFLMLVVSLKILQSVEILAAPYFIGGVVVGILANTIFLYQKTMQTSTNEPLSDTITAMEINHPQSQQPQQSPRQGL